MRRSHRSVATVFPVTVLMATVFALVTAASAFAWEWVPGPAETKLQPWSLDSGELPLNARTVQIRVEAPYCSGEKPPVLHQLGVTRSVSRVIVRAYVRWPEPLHVSGAVEPGEPEPACADLVVVLHRTVTVGAPSRHRKLFDGYFHPPKLIAVQHAGDR